MAVSASSLLRLCDKIDVAYSRASRFRDEFKWAEERQIEHYGPKNFVELGEKLVPLSYRHTHLSERLRGLSILARRRLDSPGFISAVELARKDAKAFLTDCEAWLSDARVAIPYKLGIDGRPLGKE